jgi:hypothetical protein
MEKMVFPVPKTESPVYGMLTSFPNDQMVYSELRTQNFVRDPKTEP